MGDTVMRMSEQLRELVAASQGGGSEALTLNPRPLDLRTLAHATVEDARQSMRGHLIRLELPDAPVVGDWDEARLERVLANLLSNAAKYSPEGGEISVRVGTAQDAEGVSWATVGVRDQGIGIPTDELGTIFEPFRRGSNAPAEVAGTGIGLASVRQSVELHGGQVRVASQVGSGSEFAVWLPLAPASAGCTLRDSVRIGHGRELGRRGHLRAQPICRHRPHPRVSRRVHRPDGGRADQPG